MSTRLYIIAAALAFAAGLGGIIWLQSYRLEIAERRLTETQHELQEERGRSAGLERAIDELERNAERQAQRKAVVQSALEGIVSAPLSADSEIAPVLLQGLRNADEIGGLE